MTGVSGELAGSAAPILLTKLHAPAVTAQTLDRGALFERLGDGRGRQLTLVAGPAGFGKTTLLAAWRERESHHRPVAWVSLDEGDDDVVAFWSHVIAALRRECPLLGEDLAALVRVAPLLEVALPRVINEIVDKGELALVLDDFHRISSPATRESVHWFVERVPTTLQIVLSTRVDPAIPLSALRAHGQLVELRVDELRFTLPEAAEFLNQRLGLHLTADDVTLLVGRTEGWPAGLYLAALSLVGKTDMDTHELVRTFDGTSAHVVDFLGEEVLAGYEPQLQEFMLRCSVLDRLCAELCDHVLGTDTSSATLDLVARTNLFLIPLDGNRQGFRFHHLFAQLLQLELERRDSAIVLDLHRRAFEWHRAHGTTDEAIQHALAAQLYDEAARLITERWVDYANAGQTASVLDWLTGAPSVCQ